MTCNPATNGYCVMTDTERMIAGKLYDSYKAESQWMAVRGAVKEFNDSFFGKARMTNHLKTFFGRVGGNVVLTPPFYCDHGDKIRIGSNVVIGSGCVIGAGSVVSGEIPDHSVVYGVPCRVARAVTDHDGLEYHRELF